MIFLAQLPCFYLSPSTLSLLTSPRSHPFLPISLSIPSVAPFGGLSVLKIFFRASQPPEAMASSLPLPYLFCTIHLTSPSSTLLLSTQYAFVSFPSFLIIHCLPNPSYKYTPPRVFLKLQMSLKLHLRPALNFLYSPKIFPSFLHHSSSWLSCFWDGTTLMLQVHKPSSPLLSTLAPYWKSPPESSWAPPILTVLSHPVTACLGDC